MLSSMKAMKGKNHKHMSLFHEPTNSASQRYSHNCPQQFHFQQTKNKSFYHATSFAACTEVVAKIRNEEYRQLSHLFVFLFVLSFWSFKKGQRLKMEK